MRLDVFGSAARSDFDPVSSDIDLVASFARTSEPGYADRYLDFAESLEALFGRKVDLLTPGAIRNPRLAETIKRESVPIYEKPPSHGQPVFPSLADHSTASSLAC